MIRARLIQRLATRRARTIAKGGSKKLGNYTASGPVPMDAAWQAQSQFGRRMEIVTYVTGFTVTVWSYYALQNALNIGIGVCGF